MTADDSIFVRLRNDVLDQFSHFDTIERQLDITINAGFFANCSITLSGLTKLYPSDAYTTVNWPTQSNWRNDGQEGNLFELYFRPNSSLNPHGLEHIVPFRTNTVFRDLPFEQLTPYIKNYFSPCELAESKLNELVRKYDIEYDGTIGLCYRGTDKFTELVSIPPGYFLDEARRLLRKNPSLKVLVQTDQEQVRNLLIKELGARALYFSELPVTRSLTAIHELSKEIRGLSNFELGINLLATVNILARCKYVISSTGNVGLWIFLYRGTARNTCQIRAHMPSLISQYDDETHAPGQAANTRDNLYSAIDKEEIYALRTENTESRSKIARPPNECGRVKSSVMNRWRLVFPAWIERRFSNGSFLANLRRRLTRASSHTGKTSTS